MFTHVNQMQLTRYAFPFFSYISFLHFIVNFTISYLKVIFERTIQKEKIRISKQGDI